MSRGKGGRRGIARPVAFAQAGAAASPESGEAALFCARAAGQTVRAKRAVLGLAPQAEFPAVAERMAKLWPEGESPRMERAS